LEVNDDHGSCVEDGLHPDDAPDCPVQSFAYNAEFDEQDGE